MREKTKYLVRQKRYIVEENTQNGLENLENMMDLIEQFKKEIRKKRDKKSTNEEAEIIESGDKDVLRRVNYQRSIQQKYFSDGIIESLKTSI